MSLWSVYLLAHEMTKGGCVKVSISPGSPGHWKVHKTIRKASHRARPSKGGVGWELACPRLLHSNAEF